MEYKKFIDQLGHKKRSIDELVKTLENRVDKVPVHSFFFGAGCSITSGITSASSLIEEWRKDIFNEYKHDVEYSKDSAITYFKNYQSDWYNKKYEYSTLFERIYSLPAHRRAYIERLVSNKFPSIGYAYFTELVKENYIDTVFTTNFDDLLNESFYSFSSLRPIVCAHDSTIKSVLVTSKRPKIMKLHGDYLFDNIKNTIRETEFLENNMRDKFIEFAKNYGLVIVGYSGSDRSIQDILYFLLKNDDFLKNGLYWCLLKDEDVNDDVVSLLWNEKAFFVEIDGFDEFFCEIYKKIKKQSLAISNSFISEDNDRKIDKLLNNENLQNTKSEILKEELKILKNKKREDSFDKIINTISDEFDEDKRKNKLPLSEQIYLYKLYEEYHNDNLDEVVLKINSKLETDQLNKEMELELLELLVKTHKALSNIKISIENAEKLIRKDPFDIKYLQLYLSVETNSAKSLTSIERIMNRIKFSSKLYYIKAQYLNKIRLKDILSKKKYEDVNIFKLENIENILLKGCECNPGISNSCWGYYFDLFIQDYTENNDNKNSLEKCKKILSDYEQQNPQSISVISRKARLLTVEKNNYTVIEKYINENRVNDPDIDKNILSLKISAANELKELEILNTLLREVDKYPDDSELIEQKCDVLLERFNNLDEAIILLTNYLDENVHDDIIRGKLFEFYLFKKDLENAKKILSEIRGNKIGLQLDYFLKMGDWNKVIELNEEMHLQEYSDQRYLASKTHALLYLGRYDEIIDLLHPILTEENFSLSYGVLAVNYDIAKCQKGKNKPPNERVERFIKYSDNKMVKVAYHILNKDYNSAIDHFTKAINDSYRSYYDHIDSYFLEKLPDDKYIQRFKNCIKK